MIEGHHDKQPLGTSAMTERADTEHHAGGFGATIRARAPRTAVITDAPLEGR